MTDDSPVSRRRVLRTVGIGATVALAGCSDSEKSVQFRAEVASSRVVFFEDAVRIFIQLIDKQPNEKTNVGIVVRLLSDSNNIISEKKREVTSIKEDSTYIIQFEDIPTSIQTDIKEVSVSLSRPS